MLPGRGYPPAAPGCAYAGYVLRAAGWRVRDVWWDPPDNRALTIEAEVAWVGDQLSSATTDVAGAVLDVLQLEGLDHGLVDPADAVRSAEALVEITRAMARFVAG